ncbi:MAG: bifunctional riboflavin kinase/FAD synthetase [Phycisphaerae bacterium]|jgi:riboflavin kinase/FMN adenylyltransferase
MDRRCIQGLESLPAEVRGGVLTIGNFDGVHLGHQRILDTARGLADAQNAAVIALTFDPPPDLVLRPADPPRRISPHAERCRLLLDGGADWVVTLKAEPALLGMEPDEFVPKVLLGPFAPAHLVEGEDFFFGRGRSGTVRTLEDWGRRAGFGVHVIEAVTLDFPEGASRISSSLIRSLIVAGRVADAHRCLGREFTLFGTVVAGQGQGRTMQFPTANIEPTEQVVPADGIYAGRAVVGGRRTPAAISIGHKPTLGPIPGRAVEAYLLHIDADCYGQPMQLSFVARLRDQQKFAGVDELRAQIAKDVERVRQICR